jgi:hypothetical protein
LDYLFKKASGKKVKTDGLQGQTVISSANETISTVDVVRSDRFWSDSGKLTSGPSSAVNAGAATAVTQAMFSDVHNNTGSNVVSSLIGRSWTSTYTNWISTDFHPYYALTVYYGQAGTAPTTTVDVTAYPYVFDYGSGTLTFIGDVPSYLSSGNNVVYVSGWTYAGIVGVGAVSTTFTVPDLIVNNGISINNLYSSNSSSNINANGVYLSNLKSIDIKSVTASNSGGIINFTQTTLSNVKASYTGTANVGTLQGIGGNPINVNQSSLTNIALVDTATLGNSSTGIHPGYIDCTSTSLCNVYDLYVTHDLFTDNILPYTSGLNNISFNGAKVNNISELSVTDSLNVAGEFIVTNLSTSNAEQMNITNLGLGTALIVNQTGNMAQTNVTQFMTASNTVMLTNYAGQTAFGSFGASPTGTLNHNALVYVENPSASNQPGVYIKQSATANTLTLEGSTGPLVNFTSNGQIGLGTTSPGARIQCASDNSTPFLKLTTNLTSNGFVVNSDGRVGVLTAPDSVYAVNVNGIVNTTSTITSNLYSQSSNINFAANTLSNINATYVNQTRATRLGTQEFPAFTFNANDSTGVFSPGTNTLAVTTGSNERLRVASDGKVGINSTSPLVQLDVVGTDAIHIPVGTTAQRPTGVNGYIRYNTDLTTFEGYGPGGLWGSLGGVIDPVHQTRVTAELTPGSGDCNIRFYIGENTAPIMVLASNGNLAVHSASNAPYDITVGSNNGGTGAISSYSNYTNMLSTLNSSCNINIDAKSLSNLSNLDVYSITSTLGNGVINGTFVELSNMGSVRTSNLETTAIHSTPGVSYINVSGTSLSNITDTWTSNIRVTAINSTVGNSYINVSGTSLSNITDTQTSNLAVTAINSSAGNSYINVSYTSLSNIKDTQTSNLQVTAINSTNSIINLSTKSLSNLNVVRAQTSSSGSASAPAFTFNNDTATGMFQPSTNNLSFSTNGSERVSVISDGKVGINSTSPQVQFDIVGTDAIHIPVGTNAQRPTGVNGYIRYNTDISSFEGFGPGGQWGTLGGVSDPLTNTYISAELTPSSHDSNIRFVVGGTTEMVLAANGNLAIHSGSNPTYDLTVVGTTGGGTGSISACNLYTSTLSTLKANSNIDVSGTNLSNIQVVDTAYLKATRGSGTMDASGIILTNLNTVDTYNLHVEKISSSNSYIDVSTNSFSNISETWTSNLQVSSITSTQNYINVNQVSLSNINDTQTSNLQVTAINSTNPYINVSTKSLSNISQTWTSNLQVSSITSTQNYINVNQVSLSNINDTQTSNLQVTAINSTNPYINVSTKSLSNISETWTSNLQVSSITSTQNYINVNQVSLSNINDTQTSNLQVTAINSTNSFINVSGKSLSNITTGRFVTVQTSNLTTNAPGSNINVNTANLSNINILTMNSVRTDAAGCNINMSQVALGNISNVDMGQFTASATSGIINASQTTLSNLNWVRTSNLEVTNISTIAPSSVITYAAGITLSNLDTVKTTNLRVTNLDGDGNKMINASGASMSNLASLSNTGTIYTNSINAYTAGNAISFNSNVVADITDLYVTNSINVAGEFFVTNVITSNAERFAIDNEGAGPAFSVNQSSNVAGSKTVAQFMSSSNLAFFINGKRQSVFGGAFQATPATLSQDAQVYVESVSADAQDAVYIKQDNSSYNALNIQYNASTSCNVVVDGSGRIGVGITPTARFHVYHDDTVTTQFIKLSTSANTNAFVVNADGTVGIGTTGTTSSTVSILSSLEVPTITPPTTQGYISFSDTTLANINTVQADQGSASAPSYTFSSDTSSGIYQSANYEVSIATDSTQRLVVDANGNVGVGTDTPQVKFQIDGVDALRIPVGTTSQRPGTPLNGSIRYNSEISSFEGYGPGGNWGSLGGVEDPVTHTRITPQLDPATHDNIIRFYIGDGTGASTEEMRLAANGNLGIHTTSPAYDLTVNGTTSTTNLYTNKLSTLSTTNAINVDNMALCNINIVQANTSLTAPLVDTTFLAATASNGVINASNITLSNMNTVDTANLLATTTSGFINVNTCTLCNATLVSTSNLKVVNIQPFTTGGTINVSDANLSNLASVETDMLYNQEGMIDVNHTSLCNIDQVFVNTKLTTPSIDSTTKQVSFNWSKLIEVDSIIVRSNITIQTSGVNTITGLPTNVVQLNNSGVVPDGYLSSNFVRIMANSNIINPSLIPALYTSDRASFIKTMDRVGVGIRNPAQKLHVYGNQVITGGNLGIGTTNPMGMLHVVNDNGLSPGVRLENPGSVDMLAVYGGSNNFPALYVNASCNVGIGTNGPAYRLDVAGTGNFNNVRTPQLSSPAGTIDCSYNAMSNVFTLNAEEGFFKQLTVSSNLNVPQNVASTTATFVTAEVDTLTTTTITATSGSAHISMNVGLNISGYDTSLVSGSVPSGTLVGLNVANYIVAQATLTVSDKRAKRNIVDSSENDDLQSVLDIPVKRFKYITESDDETMLPGFIAQEVEPIAPFAVRTITNAIPNVMSQAIRVSANTVGGIPSDSVAQITPTDKIKILVDGVEKIVTVASTGITTGKITFNESIPEGSVIFVYGTIVDDFKVLDSERLLPLVFNAVKDLNGQIASQQNTINNILGRLEALEAAAGVAP